MFTDFKLFQMFFVTQIVKHNSWDINIKSKHSKNSQDQRDGYLYKLSLLYANLTLNNRNNYYVETTEGP